MTELHEKTYLLVLSRSYIVNSVTPRAKFSPLGQNMSFSPFKGPVLQHMPGFAMLQLYTSAFLSYHSRLQRDLAMYSLPKYVIIPFVVQQLILDFDHQLVIIFKY